MNRIALRWIFVSALALAIPYGTAAQSSFIVDRFDSDISIQRDGTIRVVEQIDVTFSEALHGIFRDIPIRYEAQDGTAHYTTITVHGVTNDGSPTPYEVSDNDARMRIKIGDPDARISGEHNYTITYTVAGVLVPFETYDELYWNVTGDWEEAIERARARVSVPSGVIQSASCYQGAYGSADTCVSEMSGATAEFASTRSLGAGDEMTIAAAYTKGAVPITSVEPPPPFDMRGFVVRFTSGLLPILAIGGGAVYMLWRRFGRDTYYERKSLHDPNTKEVDMPHFAHEAIVVEYEPPQKLRPAEIGIVLDERADTLDVSATIVDLATRGYLTIKEVPKTWIFGKTDYVLTSTGKDSAQLLTYESLLLAKLFNGKTEVAISDLKDSFYSDLALVKKELYQHAVAKKFFYKNPETVRNIYRGIGIAVVFLGTALIFVLVASNMVETGAVFLGAAAGVSVCGLMVLLLAGVMPRRTAHGRELYRQARGYKLFVSGTEQYRQPFFEKQNIFMEVLPYAMVFGVTSQLAQAMKEMGIQPQSPSWYYGVTPFNIATFSDSMNSFQSSLSTAIASAPSSSGSGGGGFSGGGFGGGGGGGW